MIGCVVVCLLTSPLTLQADSNNQYGITNIHHCTQKNLILLWCEPFVTNISCHYNLQSECLKRFFFFQLLAVVCLQKKRSLSIH